MSILNLGKIDGQEMKAVVTIPGWQAKQIWERDQTSPSELAKIYAASVWAYACITIRADALAGLEWEITPEGDEDNPLQDNHPLVRLLQEVNPEMNWNDLARSLESDMNIYGNAYWLKARGMRSGSSKGLMRLNPATIKLDANDEGIQGFIQRLPGAKQYERRFPREDVIYFREYNPSNDLAGLSKLSVAMAAASSGINTQEYTAAFFANYAIPPVVFTTDQPLDEGTVTGLRDIWNRWFRGTKKQHKTGWATHGMKPNIIGYPTKDLALAELQAEIRRDICAVFRVPPSLAGAWEAANYATAKEQMRFLQTGTIKPRTEYYSGVLEAELFSEFDTDLRMKWRFDKLDVMSEDKLTEAQRHYLLVTGRIEDPLAAAEELEVDPLRGVVPDPTEQVIPSPRAPAARPSLRSNGHFQEEVRQWERFAHNRIKRGQEMRTFNTEHIPATLKKSIEGQLEAAKTPQDVSEIMRAAESWKNYP